MSIKKTGSAVFSTAQPAAANFAAENRKKKRKPQDHLEYDVMRAEALGYGCHYGKYKADHPETRAEFETTTGLLPIITPAHPKNEQERFCLFCGRPFEVKYQTDGKVYCCDDCRQKAFIEKKAGRRSGLYCSWCGRTIPHNTNKSRYCSGECSCDAARASSRDREKQKREETRKQEEIKNV